MIAQLSAPCFPLSPNHSPPSLSDITGPNFFHSSFLLSIVISSWPDSLRAPILLTVLFVLLSAQPRVAAIDAKMHRSDLCTPCTLGSGRSVSLGCTESKSALVVCASVPRCQSIWPCNWQEEDAYRYTIWYKQIYRLVKSILLPLTVGFDRIDDSHNKDNMLDIQGKTDLFILS